MSALLPLWAGALALLLLTLGGLLWPLLRETGEHSGNARAELRHLYRQQREELEREHQAQRISASEHAQAVEELERRLLNDMDAAVQTSTTALSGMWRRYLPAALLSLVLPLGSVLLYLQVGDPKAAATMALGTPDTHANTGVDVEAMVGRLEERLQQKPDDLEGWIVLARSREVLEDFKAASAAYQRAIELGKQQQLPDVFLARLHADLADALASARDGALDKPVQEVLQAALKLDPDQPKALALAGMAALREGDRATARRHWQRLLGLLEPDSDMALRVQNDLARIDGNKPVPSLQVAGVSGSVRLDPVLQDRVRPDDTVFIVARAAEGSRMPVAVLRLKASQLPAKFTLDDSNAMSPERPLSGFDELTLEARISRSGTAQRQPGQPISLPLAVRRGSSGALLHIGAVEP